VAFRGSECTVNNVGEIVLFEGLEFKVNSVEYADEFNNWLSQPTLANAVFLIVDISIRNARGKPVPYHFQPVYKLVDGQGAEYALSDQHTIMINMGQQGAPVPTEQLNPNVTWRRKLVFDVPYRGYELQVLVPSIATAGFMGSMDVTGHFFRFALPVPELRLTGRIGIHLDEQGSLTRLEPDGPAQEAGLRVGDKLLRVDGKDVSGMSTQMLGSLIMGKPGTSVSLTVIREGDPLQFNVIRRSRHGN
jgi:membrane-associated protease RseP (regulator of RpoE activity)